MNDSPRHAVAPYSLLPSLLLPLFISLIAGAVVGVSSTLFASALPAPLNGPLPSGLHGLAAALIALTALHLSSLTVMSLSVPGERSDATTWVDGLLRACEETFGLRTVTDDPRSALRQQLKQWKEQLSDRAALLSLLAALLGFGWLFLFLLSLPPLEDQVPDSRNVWLLLCGLAQASLIVAGAAGMVGLGGALLHKAEQAGLRVLNQSQPPEPPPSPVPASPYVSAPVAVAVVERTEKPLPKLPPPPPIDDDDTPPLPPG